MGAAPKFLQYDRTVGSKLFGVNEALHLLAWKVCSDSNILGQDMNLVDSLTIPRCKIGTGTRHREDTDRCMRRSVSLLNVMAHIKVG